MRRAPVRAAVLFAVIVPLSSVGGCSLSLDGYSGPPVEPDAVGDEMIAPLDAAKAPDGTPALDASDAAEAASPPKAIEFIQNVANQTEVAGSTSYSLAYSSPVGAHNTLIVGVYVGPSSTLTGVTDSLGNTFEILCSQHVDAYQIDVYLAAAYDINGGAPDTVTVHMTGSSMTDVHMHEYANVAPGNGCTHASGSGTAVDGIVSPPLTLTVPNEMIFAYAISGIVSPGTSFRARSMFDADLTEDRIVPDPGMASAVATSTNAGRPAWAIVAADFKPK